jgi:hypothetical protein
MCTALSLYLFVSMCSVLSLYCCTH